MLCFSSHHRKTSDYEPSHLSAALAHLHVQRFIIFLKCPLSNERSVMKTSSIPSRNYHKKQTSHLNPAG